MSTEYQILTYLSSTHKTGSLTIVTIVTYSRLNYNNAYNKGIIQTRVPFYNILAKIIDNQVILRYFRTQLIKCFNKDNSLSHHVIAYI